ncbi:MAG: hypothetical protein ACRC5R_05115 [Mycoplasmatales bacterium]
MITTILIIISLSVITNSILQNNKEKWIEIPKTKQEEKIWI